LLDKLLETKTKRHKSKNHRESAEETGNRKPSSSAPSVQWIQSNQKKS
jgi:hypothetical protein